MNELASNLKKIRKERDLSRKDMAELLDLSIPGYSNYETGQRNMSIDMLEKISDILNVDINYLLGKTPFKHYEHEQLKDFELVISAIYGSDNDEIKSISANIIELLSDILYSPISLNQLEHLKIIDKYIKLIHNINDTLDRNNARQFKHRSNEISKKELKSVVSSAKEEFNSLLDEHFEYSQDLNELQKDLLTGFLNGNYVSNVMKFAYAHKEDSDVAETNAKIAACSTTSKKIGVVIEANGDIKSVSNNKPKEKLIDCSDLNSDEIDYIKKQIEFIKYSRKD